MPTKEKVASHEKSRLVENGLNIVQWVDLSMVTEILHYGNQLVNLNLNVNVNTEVHITLSPPLNMIKHMCNFTFNNIRIKTNHGYRPKNERDTS